MYVRVVVYPGAKRESVKLIGKDRYEIMLKEPAQQNLANRKVCLLLATEYKVTKGEVRIISGHQSSRKIVSLPDIII